MGVMRKITSIGTLGAVDFRSDKERTARYTKQTRNAVRAGNQQATVEAPASSDLHAWARDAHAALLAQARLIGELQERVDELEDVVAVLATAPGAPSIEPPT